MKRSLLLFFVYLIMQNSFAQSSEEYFKQGSEKFHMQDYKGAIDDYTKCISLDSGNAKTYINRGIAKFVLKDYNAATEDYTKALELDSSSLIAYFYRAQTELENNKSSEAITDLTTFIKLSSGSPYIVEENGKSLNYTLQAYMVRSFAKYTLKDYEGAVQDMDLYLNNPSSKLAPNYLFRGNLYFKLKNYSSAILDFNRAIELNAKYTEAYINRGIAKAKLNQLDSACSDLHKAKELGSKEVKQYLKQYCN